MGVTFCVGFSYSRTRLLASGPIGVRLPDLGDKSPGFVRFRVYKLGFKLSKKVHEYYVFGP